MVRRISVILILLISLPQWPANAQGSPDISSVTNALVFIRALQTSGALLSGTGFFVDATGLILTSPAVVVDAQSIEVFTNDGSFPARVVEKDAAGFVLLKYGGPEGVGNVDLDLSARPRVGDDIYIVGYPRALLRPAQPSSLPRRIDQILGNSRIVFSPANSGFSGAPVVDSRGAVIGLVYLDSPADSAASQALSSAAIGRPVLEAVQRALLPRTISSRVIRPGDGIGPISLQMTIDQANRAMGRAADDISSTADGSFRQHRWRLDGFSSPDFPPALLAFVSSSSSAIVEISATASEFKTSRGNGVGDPPTVFASEFGTASRTGTTPTGNTFWNFDSRGLRIFHRRLRDRDTVVQISVYPTRVGVQPLPSPPPPVGLRADLSIRPGTGIGLVRLGMSLSGVIRLIGRNSDRSGPDASGRSSTFHEWRLGDFRGAGPESPYLRIWVSNERNEIHEVQTTAVEFRTPGGNGVGSPVDAFRVEYGSPSRVESRGTLTVTGWDTAGIGIWHAGAEVLQVAAWAARR